MTIAAKKVKTTKNGKTARQHKISNNRFQTGNGGKPHFTETEEDKLAAFMSGTGEIDGALLREVQVDNL